MSENQKTIKELDAEIAAAKEELKNVHGTETEVYARIVGYYRAVKNWNKGKKDEFTHRKVFDIEDNSENKPERIQETPVQISEETEESVAANNNISNYKLFARKTCPNCPPVKNYMENSDCKGTLIDVDSEEGLIQAASEGVFAAPTVIFYNAAQEEIARGHNVDELTEIMQPAMAAAI